MPVQGRARLGPGSVTRALGTLALLAFGLAAGLVTAELVVRAVRPQPLPSQEFVRKVVVKGMYLADAKAGYRPAPGFSARLEVAGVVTEFSTNSLGLRGSELGEKRGLRVAAFGDSVTFGFGVAQGEEWIAVAGRSLNARMGAGAVEAVNAGVSGYGTENEVGLLEGVGPALQPDVVLLGFFPNDIVDNIFGRGIYSVRDGYLFDNLTHQQLRESLLARESHLWRYLLRARQQARTRLAGLPEVDPARPFLFTHEYTAAELLHGVERSTALIREMATRAAALNARFGVVWLPMDWQVLQPDPDLSLDQRIRESVVQAGIPSLDLQPVFRAQPDRAGLFLSPEDTHFTPRGHRVAGEAVAEWLIANGIVPGRRSSRIAEPTQDDVSELPSRRMRAQKVGSLTRRLESTRSVRISTPASASEAAR